MYFWNVLQIEPTNDIKVIKQAFAKLSKQYHPEDSPEEFQRIKEAYRHAISYVKSRRETDDEPAESSISLDPPVHKEPESAPNPFDALNTAENTPLEEGSGSPEDVIQTPFDELISQSEQKQVQAVNQALHQAEMLFQNARTRNKQRAWQDYFQSPDFLMLQKDDQFTQRFLDYLFRIKLGFHANTWNHIFIPMLREWQAMWQYHFDPPVFYALLTPIASPMSHRVQKTFKNPPIYIIIILLAALRVFLYANTASSRNQRKTISIPPYSFSNPVYDFSQSNWLDSILPELALRRELEKMYTDQTPYSDNREYLEKYAVDEALFTAWGTLYTAGRTEEFYAGVKQHVADHPPAGADASGSEIDPDTGLTDENTATQAS